jgi:hypothetical protein
MARIFSIDFEYKGETYTAVVTIRKHDSDALLSVYVPDVKLHHILPGGKINLDSLEDHQEDTNDTAPVHELLNSIMIAVKAHESNYPSVGLW